MYNITLIGFFLLRNAEKFRSEKKESVKVTTNRQHIVKPAYGKYLI